MQKTGTGLLHARLGIFGAVPVLIMKDQRITLPALKVYVALSSMQGNEEGCSASRERIAARAGMSERSVGEGISILLDTGWLESTRVGLGKPNRYSVCAYFEPTADFSVRHSRSADSDPVQSGKQSAIQEWQHGGLTLKDPSEKTPRKTSPTGEPATPSRGQRKRSDHDHEVFDRAWKTFEERLGLPLRKQEAVNLWRLIDWCKAADAEHPEEFLVTLMATYYALREGKIRTKDGWWVGKTFTPSMLLRLSTHVAEHMRAAAAPANAFEGLA